MKNTTNRIAVILAAAVGLAPSSLSEAGVPVFDEAISRAVTVVNWAPDPVVFDEAISRAVTVVNWAPEPVVFDEAISRAVTVVNWAPDPVVFDEAISRAVTVCNRAGVGDLDGDGDIDMDDLVIFVDVLLEIDTDPAHVEGSDLTCDDQVDGLDVQPFVDAIVG